MSRKNGTSYQDWLAREGPKDLGSRPWPDPVPGALDGMNFRHTGVYDSITRESLNDTITKSGGRVTSGVTKNLDVLLVGRDAGPKKLEVASERGATQMSEDGCYKFLQDRFSQARSSAPRSGAGYGAGYATGYGSGYGSGYEQGYQHGHRQGTPERGYVSGSNSRRSGMSDHQQRSSGHDHGSYSSQGYGRNGDRY